MGKIGIVDSGLGGLSIWSEVVKHLPYEDTIYVADQKYLPYGEKTRKQLILRLESILNFLLSMNVDLVIIACNTATLAAIKHLRKRYPVKFVGVEPGIKPAVALSKNKEILVLTTGYTAKSIGVKKLIRKFAKDTEVHLLPAPELVMLVEKGELKSDRSQKIIQKFFTAKKKGNPDVIVLGCTHYYFLKKEIKSALESHVKIYDPSRAVVRRVKDLKISDISAVAGKKEIAKHKFYTTGIAEKFENMASKILRKKIKAEKLNL